MSRATVLSIDAACPDPASVETAAAVLRSGGLVAFATETVYGLGADATNDTAVASIFAAKGRPQNNPLIAHVASSEMAQRHAASWPSSAQRLADAFWPGPLTLVVERGHTICDRVSAGLGSVALRVPGTALSRRLIEAVGQPIAAPSANRSEHVSPTQAQHVLDDLSDRIDMVIDSGPTRVGIESTVVDVRGSEPVVLRLGPIDVHALAQVCPGTALARPGGPTQPHHSPGQRERHYAPRSPTVRQPPEAPLQPGDVVLAVGRGLPDGHRGVALEEPPEAMLRLYATLRELDALGPARIVIWMPELTDAWAAVSDRLRRASTPGS